MTQWKRDCRLMLRSDTYRGKIRVLLHPAHMSSCSNLVFTHQPDLWNQEELSNFPVDSKTDQTPMWNGSSLLVTALLEPRGHWRQQGQPAIFFFTAVVDAVFYPVARPEMNTNYLLLSDNIMASKLCVQRQMSKPSAARPAQLSDVGSDEHLADVPPAVKNKLLMLFLPAY